MSMSSNTRFCALACEAATRGEARTLVGSAASTFACSSCHFKKLALPLPSKLTTMRSAWSGRVLSSHSPLTVPTSPLLIQLKSTYVTTRSKYGHGREPLWCRWRGSVKYGHGREPLWCRWRGRCSRCGRESHCPLRDSHGGRESHCQLRDSHGGCRLVHCYSSARLDNLVHNDGLFPIAHEADAEADADDKDNRKHNNEDQ